MAERDRERKRRREQRLAEEAAADEHARRRRLIKLSAAAALLAFVVLAIVIAVSQSGGDDEEGGGGSGIPAREQRLLDSLPQQSMVIGESSAPVTIEEFGDLQCPACAEYSETVVADLIAGPVRRGEVKLEFRTWVILGPQSVPAAEAALAAGEQDRAWNFVTAFYANQGAENSGYVTDDFLTSIAEEGEVPDVERWQRDRESDRWEAVLQRTDRDAQRHGLTGTPGFVVQGPAGSEVLAPPLTLQTLEAAVADAR